MGQLRDN